MFLTIKASSEENFVAVTPKFVAEQVLLLHFSLLLLHIFPLMLHFLGFAFSPLPRGECFFFIKVRCLAIQTKKEDVSPHYQSIPDAAFHFLQLDFCTSTYLF